MPGRILLPPVGKSPFPLALLAHAAESASEVDAVAERWVRGGAAVAHIDLPLHGARASAKLGDLLRAGLGQGAGGAPAAGILHEFTRQAVLDLRRCLDALARVGVIDVRRVAFIGLGLGARVGAAFCALEPRPGAAALAAAGDPREVLWVEAGEGDPPGRALEAIGAFLRRHLGLARP